MSPTIFVEHASPGTALEVGWRKLTPSHGLAPLALITTPHEEDVPIYLADKKTAGHPKDRLQVGGGHQGGRWQEGEVWGQ
jgi:hypothetical protein